MSIVRWKPRGEIFAIQDEINRVFDGLFGGMREDDSPVLVPPTDIVEDGEEFVVSIELPGMSKDDVKLTLKDDSLTVSGSKKRESESREDRYYRVERSYGSFCRTINLPSKVDSSKILAEFKNGILTIRLPKSEEAKPKEIAIKS